MTHANQPLGMSDFFALEAGEYLERLDGLLQASENAVGGIQSGGAEEFVRLARALRGSALMASQQPIARAAAGLEALARAVREGHRTWDAQTKQLGVRAVDDLKIFLRRVGSWTEADTAKAEALGAQLEQLAGRPSAQIRAVEALGLDAGARAFVAREGAAIASALDRAARALRANPLAHDPLQQVLRATHPLRGLAALNDLPPLPDLLEGIERAIEDLSRVGRRPPQEVGELFQAAAVAIARAARDVAERGRPEPEGAEFKRFAALLMQLMEAEPDVVPIEALYFADSGPHIIQRGTLAARPATLGRVELVSHGEHLRQAADSLERAPSATQRELRAHTLAGTFRALGNAGGGPLADRVAQFAMAAREALSSGIAVKEPWAFAAELRRAGDLLARSASSEEAALAAQLEGITTAMRALARGEAPPVVPIEALAPAAAPVPVPIAAAAAPAPAPAGVSGAESGGLVGSWIAYTRLAAGGVSPASLEELLGGAGAPAAVPPRPAAEPAVVDIRTLLYRGERALDRARELRAEAQHASPEVLRALVEEALDLVALSLEPTA